jgi:ABC-type amino acid transport substrate-binding protein
MVFIISISLFGKTIDDKIKIMTENYPPYNMEIDGKLKGISVDILEAMLKDMGIKNDRNSFLLTNWSRAYSIAQKKKNHMVFSTTRTASRENLFKWVGPITKTTISIIAPKNKHIVIKNISDLKKYRIGTIFKDIGEQLLFDNGIDKKNIHQISGKNSIKLSLKKMENNRIDMFAYEFNVIKYIAKSIDFNWNDYEIVYILKETELYYAFNKDTDDKIIVKWQKALDSIKKNGVYDNIIKKY